jgi:hypothetical protein
VPRQRRARAIRQYAKSVVQTHCDLLNGHRAGLGRGHLQRQRDAIEAMAHFGNRADLLWHHRKTWLRVVCSSSQLVVRMPT